MDIEKVVGRIESRLYEIGKTKTEFYKEVGVSSAVLHLTIKKKPVKRPASILFSLRFVGSHQV